MEFNFWNPNVATNSFFWNTITAVTLRENALYLWARRKARENDGQIWLAAEKSFIPSRITPK